MTKQPVQKQSFFSALLRNRILIVVGCVVLILGFLFYLVIGSDKLAVHSLNHKLDALPVPSSWQLQSKSSTPNGFWGSCIAYPDLTCPSAGMTYSVSQSKEVFLSQMKDMMALMRKTGYVQKASCLEDSCVYYSFSMYKDGFAVGALAHESGGHRFVHLGISKG